MTAMIPFDGEAGEWAAGFLGRSAWGSILAEAVKPYEMDPIPPLNAKGGRTVPNEGWKSVYEVMVLPGE
jgi:acyl-coenzyme A thioesterase 13